MWPNKAPVAKVHHGKDVTPVRMKERIIIKYCKKACIKKKICLSRMNKMSRFWHVF